MTKFLFIILSATLSASAFASGSKYTCTPSKNNSSFTEDVSLFVYNESKIEVNRVKLSLDDSYTPRTNPDLKRYAGETERATGWMDSGEVEVFFNHKKKRLYFRVRGEDFISESFSCN